MRCAPQHLSRHLTSPRPCHTRPPAAPPSSSSSCSLLPRPYLPSVLFPPFVLVLPPSGIYYFYSLRSLFSLPYPPSASPSWCAVPASTRSFLSYPTQPPPPSCYPHLVPMPSLCPYPSCVPPSPPVLFLPPLETSRCLWCPGGKNRVDGSFMASIFTNYRTQVSGLFHAGIDYFSLERLNGATDAWPDEVCVCVCKQVKQLSLYAFDLMLRLTRVVWGNLR